MHMNYHHARNRIWTVLSSILLTILLILPVFAYPAHTNYISDPENILSTNTKTAIESANVTLYSQKEVRIAVCLVTDTGEEDIASFSRKLFTQWEMCDGVLLVLDTHAQTYFAVQSVDIDDILTNVELSNILNTCLEEDFSTGNVDKGVQKTVAELARFMEASLPDPHAGNQAGTTTPGENTNQAPEEKASPFLTICKVILWIIVIAALLVVGIFVLAMFNEDVADLLRSTVFRRNSPPPRQQHYYDERLYGAAPQRRNTGDPYGQNGYSQNQRSSGYPQRQGTHPGNRSGQAHAQNRQQPYQYDEYAEQYAYAANRNRQNAASAGQIPAQNRNRPAGSAYGQQANARSQRPYQNPSQGSSSGRAPYQNGQRQNQNNW